MKYLLIDLDTPNFAASAAAEKRSILVKHKPTNKEKQFDNRTAFKQRLKELDLLHNIRDYEITDQQEPEPIENACKLLKNIVNRIKEHVQADEVEYCVSGKSNFRDLIKSKSKYKSGRSESLRPWLLSQVREFSIKKYKPYVCNGFESDDYVVMRGYELMHQGHDVVVATIDKDQMAYSGFYVFNQDHPERGEYLIPDLGELHIVENGSVKGSGFLWYCHQMLIGDSTDTIKPSELHKQRFGEKSSYKLLQGIDTKKNALEAVISVYKQWFLEPITYTAWDGTEQTKDWLAVISMYHKFVRMKSHEFDELCFVEFAKDHGVDLTKDHGIDLGAK